MGSRKKGTISPGATKSLEEDTLTQLLSYSIHHLKTLFVIVVARCGEVITPLTSVWISSRLSMRRRRSATAATFIPTAYKRCDATKEKVTILHSASSMDGMTYRGTHEVVHR